MWHPRLRVLELDHGAQVHFVLRVFGRVDDARVADQLLDFQDAALDEGLLLLRVLVLGVLRDVAKFFSVADAFVDFAPVNGLELVELFFELLQAFFGKHQIFIVQETLRSTHVSLRNDARHPSRPAGVLRSAWASIPPGPFRLTFCRHPRAQNGSGAEHRDMRAALRPAQRLTEGSRPKDP